MTSKQEQWRAHVAAARDADMALSDYARQHGLSVRSLYNAKRKAKAAKVSVPQRRTLAAAATGDARAFVPIVVKTETNEARDRGEAVVLRAQFPNGVQLSWTHRGGNGLSLSQMLDALAGLPCSN
jgi:transposase-like protein